MASTAINAQGVIMTVEGTTPGTADLVVGNLISFSGLDGEAAEIDITNLASTAKEKMSGLQDFGSFSGSWHPFYGDVGQDKMRLLQASGALVAYLFVFADGSTIPFNAVCKNAQAVEGGVDAVYGGSFSLSISGAVTPTAAT
jgi:hypothetical protein